MAVLFVFIFNVTEQSIYYQETSARTTNRSCKQIAIFPTSTEMKEDFKFIIN